MYRNKILSIEAQTRANKRSGLLSKRSLIHMSIVTVALSLSLNIFAEEPKNTPLSEPKPTESIMAKEQAAKALSKTLTVPTAKKVIDLINPYTDEVSVDSLINLAKAYNFIKDYKNETRILEIVVLRSPKNFEAHYILGVAYLNSDPSGDKKLENEYETKGVQALRKAVLLNKKFEPAYNVLLQLFLAKDNRYESRIIVNDMIKRFGKKKVYYNHLCRLNSIDGYLKSSLRYCKKAIRLNPNVPDNFIYLSQTYKDKKEDKKAVKVLVMASKRFPKSELAQWVTAEHYFEQKNYSVANRYYKKGVSADPESIRSVIGFAKTSFELKKYEDALASFKVACRSERSATQALRNAQSRLRQDSNFKWEREYSKSLIHCIQ